MARAFLCGCLALCFAGAPASCAPTNDDGSSCPSIRSTNGTRYAVTPDRATPKGVRVDASGQSARLDQVDCVVDALERCVNRIQRSQGKPASAISRDCLTVKIAPDWSVSQCTGNQQFPCQATASACAAAPSGCPCTCAGIVQDGDVAVVTPDLHALAHELTHVITDVTDPILPPWNQCAAITVSDCASR